MIRLTSGSDGAFEVKHISKQILLCVFTGMMVISLQCKKDSTVVQPPPPADSTLGLGNPFWSKDGKSIFGFSGNLQTDGDDLYKVDSSGGVAKLVMRDNLAKDSPLLSPDGTKIAYLAAKRGYLLSNAHVWSVNSDGTNAHDLTPLGGNWENIRWSPDSRYILFDGGIEDSGTVNYQIARADLQLGVVILLTRAMTYGNRDAGYLADGQRIAYLSGKVMTDYGGKIWVMGSDGTSPVPLDTTSTASAYPRPSPARNEVYFAWGLGGESDAGTYSINLDSVTLPASKSSFRYVSTGVSQFMQWSPDGNLIVYPMATSSTGFDLFVMNRDGGNANRLTNGIKIFWPKYGWSSDSKHVVFAGTDDQYESVHVFVVDLKTNTLRRLAITTR
jgi:Tol biopolymer transport system component